MDPIARLQAQLLRRGETVACAESLTGGSLGAALSSLGGASGFFRGGVISYATEVKRSLLGVTAPRVVSAQCATQMADGVRSLLDATWGVSTTGVAGPEPQDDQPVGTVFVAISGPRPSVREFGFDGDRDGVRRAAVAAAIDLLLAALDD